MSGQQQKPKSNGELAPSENNAGDIHHIYSADLSLANANKLQQAHGTTQAAEVRTVTEDSGHGTDNEECIFNCHTLVPFIPQLVHHDVPVLTTAESSQQTNVEFSANPQTENNHSDQQYNVPYSQARNDVYGTPITYARVSEDDFKALNYGIFGYEAPRGQIMDGSRIVSAFVGGKAVLIHARVLVHSKVLYEIYNNGSEADIMNRCVFPEIGLPEFKILMLAIYGIKSPILGFQAYEGADYIKALSLCTTFRCEARVYKSIVECTRGYFNAFKNWKEIPFNGLTQDLHRKEILDINEAYKAFKSHTRGDQPIMFTDNDFALLLWEFCPVRAYCLYSDILDRELVRQVSIAALRQRDNISPFAGHDSSLFNRPGF
ncbi:hypothetical protein FHL15_005373 [Xylaria flabelliformis]|uniref:BTB domain-containing protein n=1 Tax=Xylaria flabelliformis TaxID=2512241 RepID=A0A553I0H1_9PEZI|nr:hypothetical protein FHL15_005373 [Xylaria flabelliformis]